MDEGLDDEDIKIIKHFMQYAAVYFFLSAVILQLWYLDFNIRRKAELIIVEGVITLIFMVLIAYMDKFIDVNKLAHFVTKWMSDE